MMNWAALMGSAFPAALPAESTIKLIFIVRPQPLRVLLRNWPSSQDAHSRWLKPSLFLPAITGFRQELGEKCNPPTALTQLALHLFYQDNYYTDIISLILRAIWRALQL